MITTLHSSQVGPGLTVVFDSGNAPLRRLSLARLKIEAGISAFTGSTESAEIAVHVMVGRIVATVNGRQFARLGGRGSVFAGAPHVLHLPPGVSFSLAPETETADVSLARCVTDKTFAPYVVRPEDVRVHAIGDGPTRRAVYEVIGERAPGDLRLGETINPPGGWSSYPPHSFDRDPALAEQFEEAFLYIANPRSGFGLQPRRGLYCDGSRVDDVLRVGSGDYAVLPLGEHPVVAGPETTLWYGWYYISPIAKQYSRWAEEAGGYA